AMRLMVCRRRQSSLARTTCSTSRTRSSLKPHPPGEQASGIRHRASVGCRVRNARCRPLGGLLDAAEPQAGGAYLETHRLAVDDRPDLLQVRLEAALRAPGDLSAHAALGLGQAAPGDLFAAEGTLVADRAPAAFGQWLNHAR